MTDRRLAPFRAYPLDPRVVNTYNSVQAMEAEAQSSSTLAAWLDVQQPRHDKGDWVDEGAMAWARLKWQKHKTVWHIDHFLANQLLNTEPPNTSITEDLLYLPFPAIYFTLPAQQFGNSQMEGCYLAEDRHVVTHLQEQAGRDAKLLDVLSVYGSRSLLIVTCSRAYDTPGIENMSSYAITKLASGSTLADLHNENRIWTPEIRTTLGLVQNFALNFLYAYRLGYLETVEEKTPWPKSPKKIARLERHGITPTRIVVRLGKRSIARSRPATGTGSPVAAHWVRGHWHGYWVSVCEEADRPERTEERNGRTYYLVLRWIEPYPKGLGTSKAQEYRVVQGHEEGTP